MTPPPAAEPSSADWLLITEDGKTNRFRDLTTLQKWIVERKVTADDRVSQKGGPWMRLGELAELAPFFDVVSQADRARASELGAPVRRAPAGSGGINARATVDDDVVDDDLYTSSGKHPQPPLAVKRPVFDSVIPPEEDYEPLTFTPSYRGAKILAGIFIAGLAVVAAYAGFKRPHWLPFFQPPEQVAEPAPAPPPSPPPPRPAAAPAPPAPAPAPSPAAAASPSAAITGSLPAPAADGSPSATAPAADGHAPAAVAQEERSQPVAAPAAPVGDGAPPQRPAIDPLAATQGKSYERLVSDADRLLENGQTTKAQKLYDQALTMQPNGVAALTGSGFLQLDRQKPMAAISLFKRAVARAPGYPPALFGLGEAYRAQGSVAIAIDYYRQYLAAAPGGPDAHAARGQLKELEAAPQRRSADSPSAPATIPSEPPPHPEARTESAPVLPP